MYLTEDMEKTSKIEISIKDRETRKQKSFTVYNPEKKSIIEIRSFLKAYFER